MYKSSQYQFSTSKGKFVRTKEVHIANVKLTGDVQIKKFTPSPQQLTRPTPFIPSCARYPAIEMTTPNLTPIQKHFLYLFATGTTFPDAAIAVGATPDALHDWRAMPAFDAALNRARHDHFRHLCDLAQIEEIRSYLNRPKSETATAPTAIVQKVKTAKSAQFGTTRRTKPQ